MTAKEFAQADNVLAQVGIRRVGDWKPLPHTTAAMKARGLWGDLEVLIHLYPADISYTHRLWMYVGCGEGGGRPGSGLALYGEQGPHFNAWQIDLAGHGWE